MDDVQIAEDLGVLAPVRIQEIGPSKIRRQVRNGRWQRVGRCAVTHNGPLTGDQLMWCGVLSPICTAAVAREYALRIGGVRGLGAVRPCIAIPWGSTARPITGIQYVRTRHLSAADLVGASLPLRMTPARALVDAASRASPNRARTLVAMVVQQKRAEAAAVRRVLDRLPAVRQEVLLRVTLDDVEGGAHSLPELRFSRLVREAGLPLPTRQVPRRRPDGRWYLDVGWEQYGLVGEIDGAHHRDVEQWEADVLRHDELMIGGDRVLRLLSWWVRERPDLVVDLLRRALIRGGWRG